MTPHSAALVLLSTNTVIVRRFSWHFCLRVPHWDCIRCSTVLSVGLLIHLGFFLALSVYHCWELAEMTLRH